MTVRGWTSVDSYFEYLGFVAQQGLFSVLEETRIVWIVVACGLIALILRAARGRVEPAAILFYLGQLLLLGVILAPARGQVAAPEGPARDIYGSRGALIANAVMDGVVRRAIERIDADFAQAPFAYERLRALLARARFHDAYLGHLLREFADQCGEPTFASQALDEYVSSLSGTEDFAPVENLRISRDWLLGLWDDYGAGTPKDWMVLQGRWRSCVEVRELLRERIRRNLSRNELYRQAAELYEHLSGRSVDEAFEDAFVRQAVANELAASASETARVREVLPASPTTFGGDGAAQTDALSGIVDMLAGAVEDGRRWLEEGTRAKYAYSMFIASAPHVYGLAQMTFLALFPLAALFALLPGRWTLLILYMQIFLSVKLWPLLWALYSAFHRSALAARDIRLTELDGWTGPGVIALLWFYLATPTLSLVATSLMAGAVRHGVLSRAGAAPSSAAGAAVGTAVRATVA